MKITRQHLIEIYHVLNEIDNRVKSVKLGYIIALNLAKIKPEVQRIEKLSAPKKDFLDFDKKRIELCKVLAEKDEDGHPKAVNGNFVITDLPKLEEQVAALRGEYADAIKGRANQEQEVLAFLEEEVDVKFFPINPSWFQKEDVLGDPTTGVARLLVPLIGTVIPEITVEPTELTDFLTLDKFMESEG